MIKEPTYLYNCHNCGTKLLTPLAIQPENPTVTSRLLKALEKMKSFMSRRNYVANYEYLQSVITQAESELANATPKQLPTQEYIDSAQAAHVYMSQFCPFDRTHDQQVYSNLSKAIVFAEYERDNATPKVLECMVGDVPAIGETLHIKLCDYWFFAAIGYDDNTQKIADAVAKSLGMVAKVAEK